MLNEVLIISFLSLLIIIFFWKKNYEIASLLKDKYNAKSKIIETERNSPMPHNGFRLFDNSEIYRAFPDIKIKKFRDGVNNLIN